MGKKEKKGNHRRLSITIISEKGEIGQFAAISNICEKEKILTRGGSEKSYNMNTLRIRFHREVQNPIISEKEENTKKYFTFILFFIDNNIKVWYNIIT